MLVEKIESLIKNTEDWRLFHKRRFNSAETRGLRHGAGIEAAACAIRLKALRECLEVVKENS